VTYYAAPLLAFLIDRPPLCCGAIMSSVINEFHVIRVEDFKPLFWHDLAEICEPDELVYLVGTDRKNVIISDVRVCVPPQSYKSADNYQTAP
jgi:hypothetical protein